MMNAFLTRWARTRSTSATLGPSGLGRQHTLLPPARPHPASFESGLADDSIWQRLLRWMPGDSDPWGAHSQPALLNDLPAARSEFQACLHGLAGESVEELQRSIRRSRSLRDLWHLRTWLYTEVARAHNQHEAEQRLQRLSACFAPEPVPVPVARCHDAAAARH